MRTEQRLENAKSEAGRREDELEGLEIDLQEDLADLVEEWEAKAEAIEPFAVGLETDDVQVDEIALAWIPTE